jgi:zinc/manganese transport system substrate-binding protein
MSGVRRKRRATRRAASIAETAAGAAVPAVAAGAVATAVALVTVVAGLAVSAPSAAAAPVSAPSAAAARVSVPPTGVVTVSARKILAVGAENEYANVIAQVGGRYVRTTAIMSNPNTDPHTFEVSPSAAQEVASAALVVQNGLGYDSFMERIEAAAPDPGRRVIDVRRLLHRPESTPNPHLWYDPSTMPAVAKAIARDLSALEPAHRTYFEANAARFDRSLAPWRHAIAALRHRFPGAPVATTEPVADYLLQAAGLHNMTPFAFQADVMNGVDPSPQDVADEQGLLRDHRVRVFVYNVQVTDTLTASLLAIARAAHVPVVGVYETMPTPGFDYQRWMVTEVSALQRALADGKSATRL